MPEGEGKTLDCQCAHSSCWPLHRHSYEPSRWKGIETHQMLQHPRRGDERQAQLDRFRILPLAHR